METYTESNSSVTDTLVNSLGCDSVVTLDLTINPVYNDTSIIYSCKYYWNELETTFQSSTIVTYVLKQI